MNRHDREVDAMLERHLGLHREPPPDEMAHAQQRALLRLRAAPAAAPRRVREPGASWRLHVALAAAAAAAVFVLAVAGPAIGRRFIVPDAAALIESAGGNLRRASGEAARPGDRVASGEVVRTGTADGAQFVLADGSRVEMRALSELSWAHAADGLEIHLARGSIIVDAAKQRDGHLYVRTRDVTVAVVGTVFLVNAEDVGSRVAVIEGEVRVQEGRTETTLRPGQQVSTTPALAASPVREAIAWSRHADAHLAILATFERGMAATAGPLAPLRDTSSPSGALRGQGVAPVPAPEFEEASIRPCDPDNVPLAPAGARGGGVNSMQMTPGRLHALCVTVATLVRTAYGYAPGSFFRDNGRSPGMGFNNVYGLGVEDGLRVRGGPDWVRSERYTINAVAEGPADGATMSGPMLRALLERRFGLKTHIESELIPGFTLRIARGGLKMKEGTCTPAGPNAERPTSTAEMVRKNVAAARRGATTAFPCGFAGTVDGPNMIFVGAGAGIPALSGILGAPVVDETGIPSTARFNYVLEFSPDDTTQGPLGRLGGAGAPLDIAAGSSDLPRAPNIFTALEEQLGLTIEPGRAPRDFIVIDHVERPSPD